MTPRRWWMLAAAVVAVGLVAVLTIAYLDRIGPQWPATEGEPYEIALDSDGCPIIVEPLHFVDSPGELVPPNPTEAILCTTRTDLPLADFELANPEPKVRVLRAGATEFAAFLNTLLDRNADWRRWQRKHSGFWPDAPPEYACPMIGYSYEHSFVLRYADHPPVALISRCGTRGWTTGSRTRMETWTKPNVIDQFLQRYEAE